MVLRAIHSNETQVQLSFARVYVDDPKHVRGAEISSVVDMAHRYHLKAPASVDRIIFSFLGSFCKSLITFV